MLLDYERLTLSERRALSRLDDSKVRDPEARERLFPLIVSSAVRVGVVTRCVRGIDDRGLHVTNLQALRDSLRKVAVRDCICLIDGFGVPPFEFEQRAVIDGDAQSAAIAAASVIAKVTRDRYMHSVAERLPDWSFENHVGYSTPEHRAAIERHGISPLHRRSFQSVAYQQLAIS